MSLTSLEILRRHRGNQLQKSPASELFQISGGVSFYGIFDMSHFEDNKDSGNITRKNLKPVIMVAEVPEGLDRNTIITRENGTDSYKFNFVGKDEEGVPLIWLY